MNRVATGCLLLSLALAGAGAPFPAAAAPPRHAGAGRAHSTAPPRGDWFTGLLDAIPEMGLESGRDSCGSRLNDLSPAGRAAMRAALDRAYREAASDTANAGLIRARVVRERMQWLDLGVADRDPGFAVPTAALSQPLIVPNVSNQQRFSWVADRMDMAPQRILGAFRHAGPIPEYMGNLTRDDLWHGGGLAATLQERSVVYDASPPDQNRITASSKAIGLAVKAALDSMPHILKHIAGDPRPDPAKYRELLRDGYGFTESADSLEADLSGAVRAARRQVDSLAAVLSPTQHYFEVLEILKGSHPTAPELLAAVGAIFRNQESLSAARWPGLDGEALEITETGAGLTHQGTAVGFLPPRPLQATREAAAYTVTIPEAAEAMEETHEGALSQANYYVDTVAAARHSAPGENTLWHLHRAESPVRLWAAGAHPFQGWGYFAQELCARGGLMPSVETRLTEAWTRLLFLSRGLADLRMGLRRVDPPVAALELEEATGQPTPSCVGTINASLEYPARRAGPALMCLHYRKTYEALRAKGASEMEALRRLADVALDLPLQQARELGLASN